MTKVYVVLLNWNGWKDTVDCLGSLLCQRFTGDLRVVVVDNASTDDSIEEIRSWAEHADIALAEYQFNSEGSFLDECFAPGKTSPETAWLTVISCNDNIGFCLGNNLGMEYAEKHSAEYALILNNDTICDPDMVSELVKAATESKRAALISPLILYADKPDTIWWQGGRFNKWLSPSYLHQGENRLAADKSCQETDWVSGCATFIPMEIYQKIGLYDPSFFIWCEEWDFSIRARKCGINLRIAPNAIVYHKVGKSLGIISPLTFFYAFRNMCILRKKYLPRHKWIGFMAIYFPLKFVQSVIYSIRHVNKLYLLAFIDVAAGGMGSGSGKWSRQKG